MPFALLGPEGPIRSMLDGQLKQGIGHVSGLGLFGHKTPDAGARTVQRYLVTETRLKIPAIFHNKEANGVVSAQFTHFPTPIGLAREFWLLRHALSPPPARERSAAAGGRGTAIAVGASDPSSTYPPGGPPL